jgi:FixJ family two-component response regulator
MRTLVAIVDDDESVRESLPDLLKEFGFEVDAFPSAESFLASGFLDQTQCLLLDIAMPEMSGPELERELKLRHRHIPIVFMTAHASEGSRPRLLSQGAVACLIKPFDPASLLAAIHDALGRREEFCDVGAK